MKVRLFQAERPLHIPRHQSRLPRHLSSRAQSASCESSIAVGNHLANLENGSKLSAL